MKTQTVFICEKCGQRIEYDFDLNCYLDHRHEDIQITEEGFITNTENKK